METAKIVNTLRKLWLFSPERREAIKASKCEGGYRCCVCGGIIPNQKLVKVDHKEQVRSHGWDWNDFMERLFCPSDGLQIMCKACHDKKSKEERELASMIKYGEEAQKLMYFFKCLYYKHTEVHDSWYDYSVTDLQYDTLENCLKRISKKTYHYFPVVDYVGFYRGEPITDAIANMCEKPVGADVLFDDEIEHLFNKFFRRTKNYGIKQNKVKF